MSNFITLGVDCKEKDITDEELLSLFGDNVNPDLILFMTKSEEVEITYKKDMNCFRFDFVDIKDLILSLNTHEFVECALENARCFINIDIDLKRDRIVLLNAVNGMRNILESNLDEDEKMLRIKGFKSLQAKLLSIGFEVDLDSNPYSLNVVYQGLSNISLDLMAKAIYIIELEHMLNNNWFVAEEECF